MRSNNEGAQPCWVEAPQNETRPHRTERSRSPSRVNHSPQGGSCLDAEKRGKLMLMITSAGVVVTRIYTVSDAPPLPKSDSRNTLVNPSRVEVTFRNGQPVKLVISGPYRKKDG